MPCWEVNEISVKLSIGHAGILHEALFELGFTYTQDGAKVVVQVDGGEITLDLQAGLATLDSILQPQLNLIKREYTLAAINEVACQQKWGCEFGEEEERYEAVLRRAAE